MNVEKWVDEEEGVEYVYVQRPRFDVRVVDLLDFARECYARNPGGQSPPYVQSYKDILWLGSGDRAVQWEDGTFYVAHAFDEVVATVPPNLTGDHMPLFVTMRFVEDTVAAYMLDRPVNEANTVQWFVKPSVSPLFDVWPGLVEDVYVGMESVPEREYTGTLNGRDLEVSTHA